MPCNRWQISGALNGPSGLGHAHVRLTQYFFQSHGRANTFHGEGALSTTQPGEKLRIIFFTIPGTRHIFCVLPC